MKLKKKSGFTLIEMLVVVAIIAILVAVSIPIVGSALERARVATDAANERAAKAEAIICYLNGYLEDGTSEFTAGANYAYDATSGKLVANSTAVTPYGKCTAAHGAATAHKEQIIYVSVSANGDVFMQWAAPNTNLTLNASTGIHGNDVSTK